MAPVVLRACPLLVSFYCLLVILAPGYRTVYSFGDERITDWIMVVAALLNFAAAIVPKYVLLFVTTVGFTCWVWAGRAVSLYVGEVGATPTGWTRMVGGTIYLLLFSLTLASAFVHVLMATPERSKAKGDE